jgi:hypothetical protein
MIQELTLKQMFQIAHAFGIDLFKAAISHKLKDKTLPVLFYRNRFQKEYDEVFEELVTIGYAEKKKWQDVPFYHVTDEGEKQFRKQFIEIVNYKPEKERDLAYLKHRINFYCSYRYYYFCDDNSEHIISAFVNYYVKRYKVSHTTEDTIIRFKNELLSYYNRGLLKDNEMAEK